MRNMTIVAVIGSIIVRPVSLPRTLRKCHCHRAI